MDNIKEAYTSSILKEVKDELNPNLMFQTMGTELLLKIALGKLDAQQYAKKEMANRGLDKKGKSVSFKDAETIWKS